MFNVITCSFQTLIEMATKYFIFIVSIVATKHINIVIFYKHCQISLQKECTHLHTNHNVNVPFNTPLPTLGVIFHLLI